MAGIEILDTPFFCPACGQDTETDNPHCDHGEEETAPATRIGITGHQMRGESHIWYTDYPIAVVRNADGTYTVSTQSWAMNAHSIEVEDQPLPDPEAQGRAEFTGHSNQLHSQHWCYLDALDRDALRDFIGQ